GRRTAARPGAGSRHPPAPDVPRCRGRRSGLRPGPLTSRVRSLRPAVLLPAPPAARSAGTARPSACRGRYWLPARCRPLKALVLPPVFWFYLLTLNWRFRVVDPPVGRLGLVGVVVHAV